jgi:hypothetical protein
VHERRREGIKGGHISVIDHRTPPRSEDRWSSWIVGIEHARTLKFSERAAIETIVLQKGRVAIGGELRGENHVGLKPLLVAPAITSLHEVIAQGHV